VSLKKLIAFDYTYSKKISQIFDLNSKIRLFFQLATHTGTSVSWSIGLFIAYFIFPQQRLEIISIFIFMIIMLIPVFIIKQTVRRPRPEYKDLRLGSVLLDEWSFPSGHATRATYIMLLLPIITPTLTIFWIAWGFCMIISRLILGVHYISDIIAGILTGSLGFFILMKLKYLPIFPFL